jgi:hypothetical protein
VTYTPYLISAFTTGLDTVIQPWILPQDAFTEIVNAYLYKGVIIKRSGMVKFGTMIYDPDVVGTLPIMGIKTFVDTNNASQLLIFDTKRAAIFNQGTQTFDPLDTVDIFNGSVSSFINSASFGRTGSFPTSTFYFTNFNGDTSVPISPMRSFTTGTTTNEFLPDSQPPSVSATRNYIVAAQFIFAFRQRLLVLNTVESTVAPVGTPPIGSGTNFSQRLRWSRAGNPADSGENWNEITPGNGGFVDAPTSEQMISATLLSDCIVVKFTNSVWVIEPTSDPALPFRWVRINSFRACEAPYADIEYDRYVVSFGKRGIVACDRNEVVRVDERIANFMSDAINDEAFGQMYSARNFNLLHSLTLYPSSSVNFDILENPQTSNFALVRTDEDNGYSIYTAYVFDEDSDSYINMSTLGYAETSRDYAFQDFIAANDLDISFSQAAEATWGSGFFQSGDEKFIGGDQIGRVLFLEEGGDDLGNPIDLTIMSASWNPYKDQGLQCQMGYVDFYVDSDQDTFFTVEFFCDDIVTPYAIQTMNCLPNLGYLGDIINIIPDTVEDVDINVAQHGLSTGDQVYIYNLDSMQELTGGPYTITVIDDDTFSLDGINASSFSFYEGGGQISLRAYNNNKTWKRAYAGGKGYEHYIRITNSGIDDNLRINAIMPWFKPSGNRMIGG